MISATDDLAINYSSRQSTRADQSLRRAALRAWRASNHRQLRELDCHVMGGIVRIEGAVSSFHLKQMAQALVLRLDGVAGIENLLEVF